MIARLGFAFPRTRRISYVDSASYSVHSLLIRRSFREAMFRYCSHDNVNALATQPHVTVVCEVP